MKTLEEWGMLLLSKKNVRKNHRKTIEFVPSTKLKPIQFNESVVSVRSRGLSFHQPLRLSIDLPTNEYPSAFSSLRAPEIVFFDRPNSGVL